MFCKIITCKRYGTYCVVQINNHIIIIMKFRAFLNALTETDCLKDKGI